MHLLLTCEHAGNRVPERWRHLFVGAEEVLVSHRGYDLGAQALAKALAAAWAAPLIAHHTTRLLVEVNRSEHHPALFSPWSRKLPRAAREELLATIYRPHRARVREAIEAMPKPVVHLGIHSFTPVLDGEARQADIGLLYDPGRTVERELCGAWQARLRGLSSLRVRRNYPYRGAADGLTTALRRRFPADTYAGIEVEVNQALLGTNEEAAAIAKFLATSLPA